MNDPAPDFVRNAIREIVECQVREGAPPEVGQHVERLVAQGFLREEALALVGCVLSRAIYHTLDANQPFDARAYAASLALLPALPWGSEEDGSGGA